MTVRVLTPEELQKILELFKGYPLNDLEILHIGVTDDKKIFIEYMQDGTITTISI